ncbi:MAG: MFS transporter [Verrucomicrobiota bacterium]
MLAILTGSGPFRHTNVRLYAWFTVLYSARAYYPIFAILFLDLGLSREQFLTLNAIWAATIFLLEVPSGALADTIGRRKLILASAIMMIIEMACLLFAPQNGGWLLFLLVLTNRILSGASEAAASGADQALAFDTLKAAKEHEQWDEVLATVMSFRSIGFFSAMILGAIAYDPSLFAPIVPALADLDRNLTLRFPLALVFIQGLICLVLAIRMQEPEQENDKPTPSLKEAFATTLSAAKWVFTTPLACMVVLGGVLGDSFSRNFATLTSDYYRFIDIPTWLFGFLGAATAVTGFFMPKVYKALGERLTPRSHLLVIMLVAVTGLLLLAPAWPWWGILPGLIVMTTLGWTDFVSSKELNRLADSSKRATILSVKGLALNLGYGTATLAFSLAVASFKNNGLSDEQAFQTTLWWQPAILATLVILFALLSRRVKQRETV